MTVVARRVRATPVRTGIETWRFIVDLVASGESEARTQLLAVEGIGACVIAGETPGDAPIVLSGSGPKLRIYCIYGTDAVNGEDSNEDGLSWDPTAGDWTMSLPVCDEDLEWIKAALEGSCSRIVPYPPADGERVQISEPQAQPEFRIDKEAFNRP